MANPVDFSNRLKADFTRITEDQKIDYLTELFEDLVEKPGIKENYPAAALPLSQRTFRQAGERAHVFLMALSRIEDGWKDAWLKTMLENAMSYLARISQNTQALRQMILGETITAAELKRLVDDGVDLTDAQIYRLIFDNQSDETLLLVKQLCEMKRFPAEHNLSHLIAIDSPWTLEILQSFRPYREVTFSNACLNAALRFSTSRQTEIIRFLEQQKIEPTPKQIQFAHVHGTPAIRKSLKFACRQTSYKECHDGQQFFVRRGDKEMPFKSIIDAILEQSDLSIAYILRLLGRGDKLKGEHLDYLIQRPIASGGSDQKDYTFEILRIYLMQGVSFSEQQWDFVMQGNRSGFISDSNLARTIRLHQVYGHEVPGKIAKALRKSKGSEGSSRAINPVVKALDFPKNRPYICRSSKSLKSLANLYLQRAPRLFELLISSGIHPSESHLKEFFAVPRDPFFRLLLNDAYFEANKYNQHLLNQALHMATGDIVQELVKRGFIVRFSDILQSLETQRQETTSFLIDHFKKTSESLEPIQIEADSSIWKCLSFQCDYSCRLLKDRLDDGEIPGKKQIEFLQKNPTRYSPELLQEIERSGYSIS